MHKEFYAEYNEIEDKHWWFIGRRQILLATLNNYLPPIHGRQRCILDVGCGTGTMLQYLSRLGEAQGIDVSEEAVRFCHERGLQNVQQVSYMPLPFEDNTFDLITIFDVLEHIDDDERMLHELYRTMRPGGILMLSVPAHGYLWGPQDEISEHKRRYAAREIRRRVKGAGFRVRRLSYFNTLLFPIIAFVRVFRLHRLRSGGLKSDCSLTKPGPMNSLLARLFGMEARVVKWVDLPIGVSLLGLARKPEVVPGEANTPEFRSALPKEPMAR